MLRGMIRANSKIGSMVYISTIDVDFSTGVILDDLLGQCEITGKPASGYFEVMIKDLGSRVCNQAFLYYTQEEAVEEHDRYIKSLIKHLSKSSSDLLEELKRRLTNGC